MDFRYLGTCAAEGWPAIFCTCGACVEARRRGGPNLRMRSGALINGRVMIDLSPDCYAASLRHGLSLGNVTHVLLTHAHSDHFHVETLQMFLEPFAHRPPETGVLHVYGSEHTRSVYQSYLDRVPEHTREQVGARIVFHLVAPYETLRVDTLTVSALPATHGCPGTLFYRVAEGGKALLYAHDTGMWCEEAWAFLAAHPCDAVSLDCTNGPVHSNYTGHMGFEQNRAVRARMLAESIAGAHTRFICNHFSHNGGMLYEEMCEAMRPHGFEISFDGMTVAL